MGKISIVDSNRIIDRILKKLNKNIFITDKAREDLYTMSGGIPYFIYYLCGGALQLIEELHQDSIDDKVLTHLVHCIQEGRYPSLFETTFQWMSASPRQLKQFIEYASLALNDDVYNISFPFESENLPKGAMLESQGRVNILASPPIQVYAKLRLGKVL